MMRPPARNNNRVIIGCVVVFLIIGYLFFSSNTSSSKSSSHSQQKSTKKHQYTYTSLDEEEVSLENYFKNAPVLENDLIKVKLSEKRIKNQQNWCHRIIDTEYSHWNSKHYAWDCWDPTADCIIKERIGTYSDGGKWVCNPQDVFRPGCKVYSFGVNRNPSFELFIHDTYGCETFSFDPTPGIIPAVLDREDIKSKPKMHFYEIGLGPVSGYPENPKFTMGADNEQITKSLTTITKELGHDTIDVLKIDIEGGEFASIQQILDDPDFPKLKIQQIMLEYHYNISPKPGETLRIINKMMDDLSDLGYHRFSKEVNIECGSDCIEYAWIHKRNII